MTVGSAQVKFPTKSIQKEPMCLKRDLRIQRKGCFWCNITCANVAIRTCQAAWRTRVANNGKTKAVHILLYCKQLPHLTLMPPYVLL